MPFDLLTYALCKKYVNKYISSAAPDEWDEVRNAVRAGTTDRYFGKGDQFAIRRGAGSVIANVAGIGSKTKSVTANGNAVTDPTYFDKYPNAKPLLLHFNDVTYGVVFSAPQANYQIVTEIASGATCNIKLKTRDIASDALVAYDFTAPKTLVAGGRLRQSSATVLQYYVNAKATAENITITAGSVNADISSKLSVQCDFNRVLYGDAGYLNSAVRQYLGSAAAAGTYWEPKTIYDLKPSWEGTLAGFQNGLDPEFLAVVGKTTREVEMNTVTDNGTLVPNTTFSDKFFLPSRKEIFGDAENAGHKGTQFDLYVGSSNADRIRYDITAPQTPRYWWLRSPHAGDSYIARTVYSDGSMSNNGANYGLGALPACVIL